jgi:SsrA-binding protein
LEKKHKKLNGQTIANNKRARYDYFITEEFESGIILTGSEVKAIRLGRSSINEAHAGCDSAYPDELFLFNMNINEYAEASHFSHAPKRPRKLLLRRRQINKMLGAVRKKGMTIVPISLFFNKKGLVKVSLGLAKGKNTVDKREVIKEREWNRTKARLKREQDQ